MKTLVIILTLVMVVVSSAYGQTVVIRKTIAVKDAVVETNPLETGEIPQAASCQKDIPVYDPNDKINPFESIIKEAEHTFEAKEVERVNVPDTPLTRYDLQQYSLVSVVKGSSWAKAYFTARENGRSLMGTIGDYMGPNGAKISVIDFGFVRLTDGYEFKKSDE